MRRWRNLLQWRNRKDQWSSRRCHHLHRPHLLSDLPWHRHQPAVCLQGVHHHHRRRTGQREVPEEEISFSASGFVTGHLRVVCGVLQIKEE